MEEIENEKIYKIILAILTTIAISIITLFSILFIGLIKVEAESLSWGETTFTFEWDETIDSVPSDSFGIATNTPKRESLYIYNWEGSTRPYTYIIMDFCSNNPTMIEKMYISNTNYKDNYINDGSGETYITNQTCKLGQYEGYIIRKQFEIGKYGALDNTGYELVAAGYLNYTNTYPYSALIKLQNISLSSDDVLSNLSQSQSNLKQELEAINKQTDDIIEHQEAVKDAIIKNNNSNTDKITQNQDKNTDKVIDAIEGDGLEDTTPVDPNKKNELEEVEEGLLDQNITTSLNDIEISIDTNSNEFIWNLVTRIINTNSLIFGLVLTMLSLGVLKLVLNR